MFNYPLSIVFIILYIYMYPCVWVCMCVMEETWTFQNHRLLSPLLYLFHIKCPWHGKFGDGQAMGKLNRDDMLVDFPSVWYHLSRCMRLRSHDLASNRVLRWCWPCRSNFPGSMYHLVTRTYWLMVWVCLIHRSCIFNTSHYRIPR